MSVGGEIMKNEKQIRIVRPNQVQRQPTSPGEILREEFLLPLGITQRTLADHIGTDIKVINRIVNSRSAVTVELAMKLAATFQTTPDFWLNAQKACDLFVATKKVRTLPKSLLVRRLHGTRAA